MDVKLPSVWMGMALPQCREAVQAKPTSGVKFEFFVRVRPDVMYFALDQLPSKEKLRKNGITLTMKWARNQPADWIFIVARRSLDWFLDAMADVQDHYCLATSARHRLQ